MTPMEDGGRLHHRCFDDNELAALAGLAADTPLRREAVACPRCDSLLRACEAFLSGGPELPAAEVQRAERQLSAFVTHRLASAAASLGGKQQHGTSGRPITNRRWAMGTVLAAAAVATFVLMIDVPQGPIQPSGALRGGSATMNQAGLEDLVVTPLEGSAGDLQLTWPAVPTADRYEVLLLSTALDTLTLIGPLTEPAATLPGHLLGADGAFCRVRAFAAGKTLLTSPLRTLPTP